MFKALVILTYASLALGMLGRDPLVTRTDPWPPYFPQGGPVLSREAIPGSPEPASAVGLPDTHRAIVGASGAMRLEEEGPGTSEPVHSSTVAEEDEAAGRHAWSISAPMREDQDSGAAVRPSEPPRFEQKNLSGPRLGVTMALDQSQIDGLRGRGMGPLMSQFGWHFERQVVPLGGGPQFLVETIPMFAGVEYGEFIPSLTLAMGVRFPSGAEFGLGPSVSARPGTSGSSALVIAGGRSFDYGGVSLPINVALSTSPHGQRLSLVLGYAIQQVR